jgi:hypothetical protein
MGSQIKWVNLNPIYQPELPSPKKAKKNTYHHQEKIKRKKR